MPVGRDRLEHLQSKLVSLMSSPLRRRFFSRGQCSGPHLSRSIDRPWNGLCLGGIYPRKQAQPDFIWFKHRPRRQTIVRMAAARKRREARGGTPARSRREDVMKNLAVITYAALGLWALGYSNVLAQAPKTFTLKFNHVLGPKEPYHDGFLKWAKAVEQRTNGGLKIDVFHSAQLGVEEDIIEQIRQGANIGQNTDAARMGNYVPGIAVMNGPYFVETLEEVAKLRKAPTVAKWQEELATKFGLKVVSFNWVQGYRHFFTNKPIKTPDDLKGLRIRTPPAPIWQESIRALGAVPVAMAFGEMYPGLQQRAIDGVELVYNNIPGGRFYEVLKVANETKHIMLINFEVVSGKWFDSLPKEYQDALVEEADRAGEETSRQILRLEAEVEQQLKSRGMTINKDVDLAAFRKAGEKAYEVLKITDAKNSVHKEIGK
ncbi:C4-dicarboxylate TRAP transporter substrate-binding protein [Bradyrhizobium hereditatis]|uniref:C4-dicarboxylate TRAP transporter substrate-binding protein n=1 Tax=Bradyrhizobium hereditatis TaxID=2821405 RepID=UPI001CE2833A|nr:C4-dicarboxylate TRAP transporter substrate-binding protein [Bradyrhizobium hereditatis]